MSKDFNHGQYSKNFDQYIKSNIEGKIGGDSSVGRCELLMKYLPLGRTIFEIGSGGGEDALTLQSAGYNVIATDYVKQFVDLLEKKGLLTQQFDAKQDTINTPIDCIYANAVFVHFSPEEISYFLQNNKELLTNEKLLFMSVIKGIGHERSARSRGFERDFFYYTTDDIKTLLIKNDFRIVHLNDTDPKWIQVISKLD